MFVIKEYVPASKIWSTAKDYEDLGSKAGYVRGYNIEVANESGETGWLSCSFTQLEPEVYFNDEFHKWYYEEHQWTPTGRICFRGYGIEEYDPEEHEYYVKVVEL